MTESELENLVACYIHVEGYTDLRSIYYTMNQEYPGQFDRKTALTTIRKVLKEEKELNAWTDFFLKERDEMSAKQVFLTKDEVVQFIIACLHKEINREKHSLHNAQERLAKAERVLKVYEKYGKTE